MKKTTARPRKPDMRPEYDFSRGVRGKFVGRFPPMTRAVVLDPDVALLFPDGCAANEALRRSAQSVEIDADLRKAFAADAKALTKAVNEMLRTLLRLNQAAKTNGRS